MKYQKMLKKAEEMMVEEIILKEGVDENVAEAMVQSMLIVGEMINEPLDVGVYERMLEFGKEVDIDEEAKQMINREKLTGLEKAIYLVLLPFLLISIIITPEVSIAASLIAIGLVVILILDRRRRIGKARDKMRMELINKHKHTISSLDGVEKFDTYLAAAEKFLDNLKMAHRLIDVKESFGKFRELEFAKDAELRYINTNIGVIEMIVAKLDGEEVVLPKFIGIDDEDILGQDINLEDLYEFGVVKIDGITCPVIRRKI